MSARKGREIEAGRVVVLAGVFCLAAHAVPLLLAAETNAPPADATAAAAMTNAAPAQAAPAPADTNAPPVAATAPPSDADRLRELEKAHEALQAQHQAAMRGIAEMRALADAAAKRDLELIQSLANRIEQAANKLRERELEALESAHRMTLIAVGVLGGVAFLGVLAIAISLARALTRRAEPAAALPVVAPRLTAGPLDSGDARALAVNPAEESNAHLLRALTQLERRIHELEATVPSHSAPPPAVPGEPPATESSNSAGPDEGAKRRAMLLIEGQRHLDLNQNREALAMFEELLTLCPANAEAFLEKGRALERLGRTAEALEAYDRAIALDQSLTIARLYKAGLLNRLGRHAEALACHESSPLATQRTAAA
jgi:tetratricopeptide (TPR) repeat protein